jgi:DNA polymerase V
MTIHNWPRAIAHIDADYFYANCELARNPSLRGKPVMVFGRLDTCILAKTPEAKAAGITTAIPSWEAKKLCPKGIFLKGDFRYYTLVSRQMMEIFNEWSPVVEVYSVDEAFMDMDGLRGMYRKSYEQMGDAMRAEIRAKLGITVSVGISINKTLAKMACELHKPNGTTVLAGKQVREFLRSVPVQEIPGIGASRGALLEKYRVKTCQELSEMPESLVSRLFGKMGIMLWRELRGELSFPVASDPPPPKSIGRTSSFDKCTSDVRKVEGLAFYHLERSLSALHRHKLLVTEMVLHLRDYDYRIYGIPCRLPKPTEDFFTLAEVLSDLLKQIPRSRSWRSVGVLFTQLQSSAIRQPDLFGGVNKIETEERVNRAKDLLNERYGQFAVTSGSTLFISGERSTEEERFCLPFIS